MNDKKLSSLSPTNLTTNKERRNKKIFKLFFTITLTIYLLALIQIPTFAAVTDMWTKANEIIVDVYTKIAGISTVLAGLMTAVAVIGAKISNNQQKVEQAFDWLKRIWISWIIINGIGAFIAYIRPLFEGLNTIK